MESNNDLTPVTFDDVTVVLMVNGHRIERLAEWAGEAREDPELSRCRVVVAYTDEDAASRAPSLENSTGLPVLAFAEGALSRADKLGAYGRVFASITTPWFILTDLPRQFEPHRARLKEQIGAELRRVAAIGLRSDRPVLLHDPRHNRLATRAFLHRELVELPAAADPTLHDYLGFLNLFVSAPKVEGIDLRIEERSLEIFARVSLGGVLGPDRPSWNYRLAVSSSDGTVHTERPAALQQHIDNQGGRHWESVVGQIGLDEIPEGNHRLVVGIDSPHEELRTLLPLRPRPGVLAPARTTLLRGGGHGRPRGDIRYLIHTVGAGVHCWIMLQRGEGREALKRWDRAMLRKDARAILKGVDGRRMRMVRLLRLVTRPLFRHKSIWLVGERADTAQDNGYHLFRYLRESHPDRAVYYVIERESPHVQRVQHLGNVVFHSSLRHRLLMLHATVLANAYSIKHMIPRQWSPDSYTRSVAWRVGAYRVYLKHGVHVSPTAVKRGTGGYDLYLSVNPKERDALRASSGYRDQVVETGMPRYDTLVPGPRSRTILFMPTWRRYLVPRLFQAGSHAAVPFQGSTYESFIRRLLNSPALHEILARHDYRLDFLPHYNLRQELAGLEFGSDRIRLADTANRSFQDLIRACDVFITDYSSVHFDVAYLATPIIYTHFDKDEYEQGHAVVSWFDHDKDGFGPVVHTVEDTLAALDTVLARGSTPDPAYQDRIRDAFTFHDHDNSKRVVEQIDLMVTRGAAGE